MGAFGGGVRFKGWGISSPGNKPDSAINSVGHLDPTLPPCLRASVSRGVKRKVITPAQLSQSVLRLLEDYKCESSQFPHRI